MRRFVLATALTLVPIFVAPRSLAAPSMAPPYNASYTLVDLGVVPGVPMPYGGLVFKQGDSGTLLIGGSANASNAKIYAVTVTRGAGGHVTGFSGTASAFANATGQTAGIDGGLTYGPGNVLFYTTFPDNTLAQIKPGGTDPAKVIPLTTAPSVGSVAFVPTGFPGAGHLKILSWTASLWYDATVSADSTGTYDVQVTGSGIAMPGDPEGAVFVSAGNPQFTAHSALVSEWNAGRVSAYELDANGDPKTATQKTFVQGLSKAEGAVIDPVTGDFLFSTWGAPNTDHVIVVQGFSCVGIACGSSDAGTGGGSGGTGGSSTGGSPSGGSGGSSASGGSAGSAGAAGSAGGTSSGGSGGSSASGGASSGGTGGTGASATGGSPGSGSDSGDTGGCGCSLPGSRSDLGLVTLAAIFLARTARRRHLRR
jgi:hypothetical protein